MRGPSSVGRWQEWTSSSFVRTWSARVRYCEVPLIAFTAFSFRRTAVLSCLWLERSAPGATSVRGDQPPIEVALRGPMLDGMDASIGTKGSVEPPTTGRDDEKQGSPRITGIVITQTAHPRSLRTLIGSVAYPAPRACVAIE
jgi:hypothetical protein